MQSPKGNEMSVQSDTNASKGSPASSGTDSSSAQPWLAQVEALASKVCADLGCLLYDIEFSGTGAGRTLRVFVDKDQAGGADIEDCSNVSKGLNDALDANEDLIPGGPYNLEVSTPGIDRVLKKAWHFQKVVGKKIWVKTRDPFSAFGFTADRLKNAKQIEDTLESANETTITFKQKEGPLTIPVAGIEKAKVVFVMVKGQKK